MFFIGLALLNLLIASIVSTSCLTGGMGALLAEKTLGSSGSAFLARVRYLYISLKSRF